MLDAGFNRIGISEDFVHCRHGPQQIPEHALELLRKSRTVHHVDVDLQKRGAKEHFLFISDVHYDAMKCDRSLLHRHLDEARELGAGVFIFGDLFDLMQGRFDPRGNYADLRPEYKSLCTSTRLSKT